MGIQNRSYNKMSYQNAVIIHGSVVCQVPKELWSKDGFDKLCETTIAEGFVVLNKDKNERFKLKRENFSDKNDSEKQRGAHVQVPDGISYDDAALSNKEVVVEKDNIRIVTRSFKDAVQMQKNYHFDGQKMMNIYKTLGQGNTYRYSDELHDNELFNSDLEFQIKHDGETGLLHKDSNGKVHLLIKLQIDVFEINGSYQFGYL